MSVKGIINLFNKISLFFAFSAIIILIVFYGFGFNSLFQEEFIFSCRFLSLFGIINILLRFSNLKRVNLWLILYDVFFISFFISVLVAFYDNSNLFYSLFLILFFIRESASYKIDYRRTGLNPAQLFILSFLLIIVIGSLLLLMPNSTHQGIGLLDALFTSTSAVCVTGLTVVDTQYTFTLLGKSIILFLIQIGGLGIMTFASYFSFFFKGGSSFNNRLYFGELSNENTLSNVFSSLKSVLILTLLIESFGATLIYFSLPNELNLDFFQKLFFSIFHSVSAFNNAGFSLLSENLNIPLLAYNYPFQLIICFLIIFGGLGFPIMNNVLELFFYSLKLKFKKVFNFKKIVHRAWVINTSTKIILITTGVLLIFGTITFYIFEYNGVLSDHGPIGKWVIAFMGSVSPRTAGFNSFDMASLAMPTILITIFLMWIGGSPASTAGGIKTSTIAIAFLNVFSMAKGEERIEVSKREISNGTVRRSFSIIVLSLLTIGIASFTLILLEPNVRPLHLIFEAFSAFSTVGLSINLTPLLGDGSKTILILLMFIGRVSTLTILIALFEKVNQKNYKYPSEEVLIN